MKLPLSLLALSLSATFLLPLQSMTPREAENAREKSERLFNREQKRQESAEYKNLKKEGVNATFLEAAELRKKLLEEIDDDKSADDLLLYFLAFGKAYADIPGKEKTAMGKTFRTTLEKLAQKHQDNQLYKIRSWELNDFAGHSLHNSLARLLPIDKYRHPHLAQGEQILKGGQQKLSPQEFGQFLFDFALALANPGNGAAPAYALFHKKTDFTAPPPSDTNRAPKPDARLTDKKGAPLTYNAPATWEEARNDGERILYLLTEAEKLNPELGPEIKLTKAAWIQHAFFPRPGDRETETQESSSLPANINEEKKLKQDYETFFRQLSSLSSGETILRRNGQYVKTPLPPTLDYLSDLRELALLPLSPGKTSSDKTEQIKSRASELILQDLISRLNYEEALKLCREIQAGLPAADKSDLKKELAALESQLSQSGALFSFVQDSDLFAPEQPIRIPVLFRTPSRLKLTIHALDPAAFAREIEEKKIQPGNPEELLDACSLSAENKQLAGCFLLPESGKKPSCLKKTVQTLDYALTPVSQKGDTLDELSLPPLPSGYYLLEGQTEGGFTPFYRLIAVSGLSLNGYQTKDGYTLSLRNRQNGLPVPNADISVTRFDVQEEKKESGNSQNEEKKTILTHHFTLKTDEQGRCTFPMETPEPVFAFSASDGKNTIYHTAKVTRKSSPEHGKKSAAELVTDRPVYRPGQTVHWHAWVGQSDWKTGGKPLKNTPVTIDFGSLSPKQTLTTDERGMAGGAFTLPENAKLGRHSLSLATEDGRSLGQIGIRVEEYKKFEFQVSQNCGKKAFLFGETVPVTIRADYYSGEPVTSGTADVSVQFDGKILADKKLPLNENGEAFLSVEIPRQASPSDALKSLVIKSTVSDPSLRQIEAYSSLPVTQNPFEAQLSADLGYARADQRTSATVQLTTYGGEPVSAQGEAILYKLAPGPENEDYKKEKILSWTIATNEKGTALLTCIPPTGGLYLLETIFPANNEKTENISASIQFPVLPAPGAEPAQLPGAQAPLTIIPEKKDYKTGETAHFLIIPPAGVKNVELIVSQGFSDEKTLSLLTPDSLNEFTLPLTDDNAPSLSLQVTAVKDGSLFFASERLSIVKEGRELSLSPEITGDRPATPATAPNTFRPGEKALLKIKVSAPDGSPLPHTPVLMTVYDKALEPFLPRYGDGLPLFPATSFWANYRQSYPGVMDDLMGGYDKFSLLFPTADTNNDFSPFFQDWQQKHIRGHFQWHGWDNNRQWETSRQKMKRSLNPLMGGVVVWTKNDTPTLPATEQTNGQQEKNPPHLSLLSPGFFLRLSSPDCYSLSLRKKWEEWSKKIPEDSLTFLSDNHVSIDSFVTAGNRDSQFADPFGSLDNSEKTWSDAPAPSIAANKANDYSVSKSAFAPSYKEISPAGSTPPSLRSQFADLLKWSGPVITNEQGIVELPLQMPDNLTTWKAVAWSIDDQLRAGSCTAELLTTQDLIAQLQTPRFLVERDTAILTAVLRNNTDKPETVEASLQIGGDALSLVSPDGARAQSITIPAKGSATAQWEVLANKEGTADLTLSARSKTLNDSSKTALPVILRGAIRGETRTGTLNPGQKSLSVEFTIPEKTLPPFTQINVDICPGFAPVVLRALPFLSGYPYGCTEQGLNKFIPSLIVRKTFRDLNLSPDAFLKNRPQTLPHPLADEKTLDKQIEAGLQKLAATQNGDGGWSWFPGGTSTAHITAQVLHGLTLARKSGVSIPDDLFDRAFSHLDKWESHRVSQLENDKENTADDLDVLVRLTLHETGKKAENAEEMTRFIIRDKSALTPYSLVNLARYLHDRGEKKTLAGLLKNLNAVVETNPAEQTARLALSPGRAWWTWANDDIETQAAYLNLLTALEPKSDRTRAVARSIALNRENCYYWKSTRDTALAIEALCHYITATGEADTPVSLELKCDGKTVAAISSGQNGLVNGELALSADLLPPGKHTLKLTRTGTNDNTPVYFSAGLKFFSVEDKLAPSGNDLTVSRKLYKLTSAADKNGAPVQQHQELKEGDSLASGDLIEVELEVNAQKDYQYLMLKDPKTAGCEPFNLTSGYNPAPLSPSDRTNSGTVSPRLSWYMEPADRETRFFLSALPRGEHKISYKLRVERPGLYTALPAQIEAMYSPLLRGNSAADSLAIAPPEKALEKTAPAEEKKTAKTDEPAPGKGDETSREAFEMAFRIRYGWGEEMNPALAIRWMRKAANEGYAPALLKLADWLEESREKDPAEIIALRSRALPLLLADQDKENGDIPASLGKLYLLPDSFRTGRDHKLAPEKNRKEQGIAYIKKADELFAKAAAEGSGYAAFRRARLYQGEGIMRSPQKALQYYEQGAMTGYAPALYEAARLLPDNEKSEAFLRQAVSAKFHPAAELLAERLFARRDQNGIPVPDDVAQALKLLQTAAEGGCPDAQLALAELHKTGKFVPQDEDKAEFWNHKGQDGNFYRPEGARKEGNTILDAINGKNVPDRDIPSLSSQLGNIPLPDELPGASDNLRGKTDGELLALWKNGTPAAALTLAEKWTPQPPQNTSSETAAGDTSKDALLYNTRAREGSPEAALALSEILLSSPYPEDKTLGKTWLEFLSRQNYAPAQTRLARLVQEENRPEKALLILTALAERHDLDSLTALEKIFSETGEGAELNLPRAAAYKAQRLDTASPDALPPLPSLKKNRKIKDIPSASLRIIIQQLLDKNEGAPQSARDKLRQLL